MLELDGAMGEGGGQVLRSSLALALLTGQAFHLANVRAGRAKPGLQPQHLTSVRAAVEVGQAQVRGASLASSDLVFEPGPVTAGIYTFNVGTAGATSLVLHTVYLPLALRGTTASEVAIHGGTHVATSPCYHFLETTWNGWLRRFGLVLALNLRHPGFYPRGGGRIEASIEPCPRLLGFRPEAMGPATRAIVVSAVAGLELSIAERQARRARERLEALGLSVEVRIETWPGGPGTAMLVILEDGGVPALFSSIGARGKPAERVADEAVASVRDHLSHGPGMMDEHSADQVLLPLALAEGPSEFRIARITSHLLTNREVIRRFIDRSIEIEGEEGGPGVVRIG